jgi:hypothetical protein
MFIFVISNDKASNLINTPPSTSLIPCKRSGSSFVKRFATFFQCIFQLCINYTAYPVSLPTHIPPSLLNTLGHAIHFPTFKANNASNCRSRNGHQRRHSNPSHIPRDDVAITHPTFTLGQTPPSLSPTNPLLAARAWTNQQKPSNPHTTPSEAKSQLSTTKVNKVSISFFYIPTSSWRRWRSHP